MPNDPAKLEQLARMQAYHSKLFARFIDRMSNTPDGDGSLLDHSIILYGSNMSNIEHAQQPTRCRSRCSATATAGSRAASIWTIRRTRRTRT